ncbi:LysR family transcriptional regulator [Rhabdothermincola salaria]|uniref:LysR family transcriptional regulator n=1 Tax=Rhabdothermincola salaria TaxID=2903142 RepID=UPI001E4D08F1|nr:LysR substrate-binding domain-containing protein [Rhabdothermincola salaria]
MDAEVPLPAVTVPQLTYLVAVAEAPTFAAAAAAVGVTTSALSQGLAELERRVGVSLFERVGRRQVLREEAAEVLAYARRVVADTGDLARWAAAVRSGASGRLRVGMIDAAAVHHCADPLRAFRRSHPEVDLRLRVAPSGELLEQLASGALDLAVVVEPPELDPALEVEVLLEEPLVVVPAEGLSAAPGDRRRSDPDGEGSDDGDAEGGGVTDPASWGPWVLFPAGSHTRAVVEAALRARGAPVEVVAESHQPEVLREMARLGVGWTVLPELQAREGPRRRRPSGEPEVLATRRLVIARRAGRVTNPAADTLANALRSALPDSLTDELGGPRPHPTGS